MIVFISDLHFVDETAGKHNIPARAFEGMLKDLKRYGGKPKEIILVFLGDVFDINRSTYWLEKPESERPWGDTENKIKEIEAHANHIFDTIISKNERTFELFRGSLKNRFKFNVEPERIYIPGNHDRLCNVFPSLRKKVRETLGMGVEEKPFPHLLDDISKYRVLARHGHEQDVWNYEGSVNMTDGDYAQVPIGDLLTTEIAANIPFTILKRIGDTLPPAELARLKTNLEEIENVRPYSAIFDWLFYQTTENKHLGDEIEEALKEIIENFNNLQYPKRWYKRHDKWSFFTLDEADKLQAVMRMFKLLGMETAEGLMKIYSQIFGSPDNLPLDNADGKLVEGAKEFLTHQSEYRYAVMGHTHNPLQVPIRITSKGLEQVYLNTGTWRAKHIKGLGGGFITLKNLTYTIVYSEGESKNQEYETWTGTLKEKG